MEYLICFRKEKISRSLKGMGIKRSVAFFLVFQMASELYRTHEKQNVLQIFRSTRNLMQVMFHVF